MSADDDLREAVRARYAAAATATRRDGTAPTELAHDAAGTPVFGAALYAGDETGPHADALAGSLGCGVPTAVADLHPGETVLDLGSGAGGDVLIAARRVGPTGRAIGLDMTTEMVELARANAAAAGVTNVEILQGYLEDVPLPDDSVDVVISNCVLNLAADKSLVLREAARVLRPGGRLAFSDVVADAGADDATRADVAAWTGCIAGALTRAELTDALAGAGFTGVEVRPTHRVHARAQAATIRAVLPTGAPSVLFVCVRNGGKSPMAAALLARAAGDTVVVSSAGTGAGTTVNDLSAQALHEVGVDLRGHTPTQLTAGMVAAADLVVTLGREAHVDEVEGTAFEVWDTDEPADRGVEGLDRMRLVRDDLQQRVTALAARFAPR